MGGRRELHRTDLRRLSGDWDAYLKRNSGLPGPRANLELLAAVVEEAGAARAERMSRSADEFVAACGAAALGRIALSDRRVLNRLHELARDDRWRVREGVAIGLQRFGHEDMAGLLSVMHHWAHDADALVQRAAVATLCEPALLKKRDDVVVVLAVLDDITQALANTKFRRGDAFRALRQTLGYGWSVAVAAAPEDGVRHLARWMASTDPDVAWIVKSNLGKARMAKVRDHLLEGARR